MSPALHSQNETLDGFPLLKFVRLIAVLSSTKSPSLFARDTAAAAAAEAAEAAVAAARAVVAVAALTE